MSETVLVSVQKETGRPEKAEGTRVCFNVHRCFSVRDSESEALLRKLAAYLGDQPGLALWHGPLLEPLLEIAPELRTRVRCVVAEEHEKPPIESFGLSLVRADALPEDVKTVFVCATRAVERTLAADALPPEIRTIDASIITSIAFDDIPARAWTPVAKNIYPLKLPRIRFSGQSNLILMDCPARNLALMPNGLGYVHNALKKAGVHFETFDLDIVAYHRYHMRRLFDEGGKIVLPSGREMPTDPWQAEHYDLWENPELLSYLSPIIEEAAAAIIRAKPKILGLSIQQCNTAFSRLLVNRVKEALPDVLLLVGGFSCYNADIGLRAFPEADYMCIGESDLTVGPLVKRLAAGERPKDLPGVMSRFDTPGRMFSPAPMQHNLDQLDFPRYEWCDLGLYRNFNGYQLVPIIASRGCRWSRCTFCAERFYWRIRSPRNFVDELEWLVEQGCTLFMFNESDLNGMPEKLLEICDEIVRRDIRVRLTGQLRIQKTSDRAFYDKLRAAGFVALRFGVDAFSENTLRLQKKGYTVEMIRQNLRDCWEAGIYTEVNWVIGVPGETDADCEEGVNLILENRQYIGRLANINPLILTNGSVYWIDPERHGIRFRTSKEELYTQNPRYVPPDSWYSVDPYIDAQVRKERFDTIVLRLHDSGFPVGAWAERVIADVKEARDQARAGGAAKPLPADDSDEPALLQTLAGHKIWRYRNQYFAVPLALGDVDLKALETAHLPGVLSAADEIVLRVKIEHANSWAASRGQYDAQERQRIAGSLYRAGSALGEAPAAPEPAERQIVIELGGEFVALSRDALGRSVRSEAPRTGPLYRRVAKAVLPREVIHEIRSIWPSRGQPAWMNGRPSPWNVVRAFASSVRSRTPSNAGAARVPVPGTPYFAIRAISKGVQPTLLTSMSGYNLVEYDGIFYGLPHGLSYDWEDPNAAFQSGVIVAENAQRVMHMIRQRVGAGGKKSDAAVSEKGSGPSGSGDRLPQLIGSLEGYNLISYEGFIYGVPQSLGPLDLTETDVTELKGVIRDVSRQVVENEIRDLAALQRTAAE